MRTGVAGVGLWSQEPLAAQFGGWVDDYVFMVASGGGNGLESVFARHHSKCRFCPVPPNHSYYQVTTK